MMGLTAAQAECLAAIKRLTVGEVSPSYAELREALGLKSKCGVHRLVHALRDRGYVQINGCARSLTVLTEAVTGAPSKRALEAYDTATLEELEMQIADILDRRAAA